MLAGIDLDLEQAVMAVNAWLDEIDAEALSPADGA
jgi:hypothetical protein